jgi:hypothetical protein
MKRNPLADTLEYLHRVPTSVAKVRAGALHAEFAPSATPETPVHTLIGRWAEKNGLTVGCDNPEKPELANEYRFRRKS